MNGFKFAAGVLGAVALLAMGFWLGVKFSARDATTEARRVETAATAAERAKAPVENASVKSASSEPTAAANRTSPTAAVRSAAVPEPLRVLLDLQRRKLVSADLTLVGLGAQITPEFAELFALGADEQAALQRGLDAARERLAELRRENTSVTRGADGSVTLAQKPFPEAGGAAYDVLLRTFADTLGPERYNAFLALGSDQVEKALDRLGTAHGVVTFSREVSADGEMRYRIRAQQNDTPENKSTYVSDRLTYERLLRETGPLAKLLPSDFAPPR